MIMTKFIDKTKKETKVYRKTVFTQCFSKIMEPVDASRRPESFAFVEFIGTSKAYGDVFKACDIDGDFILYMGVKGTEFDEQ